MPIQTDTLNRNLYDLLTVRYDDVTPLDSEEKTTAPEEADIFRFTFEKDGVKYGTVYVTIDNSRNLVLYYGDEVEDSPDTNTSGTEFTDSWSGFRNMLKKWSQRKQLDFELKNKNHLVKDMAQRTYNKEKENLGESYYPMGKRGSYSDAVPNVKIIIQHTRQIGEGEQRYRNIDKIFVENTMGERFAVPSNKPGIAKVYARHIAEGGSPYDDRGRHITSLVEEYTKMAGFVRATKNKQFNESTNMLIQEGVNHYQSLRETLSRMIGRRGYNAYFEAWQPVLSEEITEETNLNELFVQETIDPRIESVMPILSKLYKKVSEMKEINQLEAWANKIIEETTDLKTIPEEELDEGKGAIRKFLAGLGIMGALGAYISSEDEAILQKMAVKYDQAQTPQERAQIKHDIERVTKGSLVKEEDMAEGEDWTGSSYDPDWLPKGKKEPKLSDIKVKFPPKKQEPKQQGEAPKKQGVAEGSEQKKPLRTHKSGCGYNYGHDCDCGGTLTHASNCHYNYGHDCDCGLDKLKHQKQNKEQGVAEGKVSGYKMYSNNDGTWYVEDENENVVLRNASKGEAEHAVWAGNEKLKQGVAEGGYQDDSKEREENLRYSRSRNPVADEIRKKLNPNQKPEKGQGVAEGSEEGSYSDKFVQSQIDYYTKHGLSGTAADRERINGSLNYYQHIKNKRIKDGTWQEQGVAEGFDSAAFDRHMEKLRAQKELEKTDPMRAMINKMKSDDDYKEKSKSKPKQDSERQITDPFHSSQGVNIGEQGVAEEGYGNHPSQRVDPRTGKKYIPPKSPLGQGVAEGSLEEYGDTNKGQKMLGKVHQRAADRVTSKQADKDPEYARKAQQTQDRAWERLAVKEQGVAEDLDANQKRVGQLGPYEKVGPQGAVGKLVGGESIREGQEDLDTIKRLLGK